MIKICNRLYINSLTLVLFAVCYITRTLELLLITYAIMLIHETAHLIAALAIGLRPSYIAIHPFGVNLRLKNKIVCSISDEMILYFAGPFSNAVMALMAMAVYSYNKSYLVFDFYLKNIALFLTNMLPIVPLDGGIILKKLIMYKKGYKFAQNVMICISVIFTALLMAFGVYLVYANSMNFSVILLAVFMTANIFTQKEKYNVDFVREMIYFKNKNPNGKAVKIYACDTKRPLSDIALHFDMNDYYVVFIIDKNGKLHQIRTETEILKELTG